MKNIIKLLSGLIAITAIMLSCKKDENRVYFLGGTNPHLSATSTDPQVLLKINKDNPAITFNWTNPDYEFNTGASSQTVSYTLQVDTAGSNFSNPRLQEKAISANLSVTLTVKELNTFLTKMELQYNQPHQMQFRIKSTLGNGSVPLYSNVLTITITNYLDFVVEPPGTEANLYLDGNLWVVGDAVASGWTNPLPPPYDVTQKIGRATPTDVLHYVGTITFNATGGYKLIQEQGVWSSQYHALDGTAKLFGDFEKKDSDPQFPSPGAGNYKIEVNFQTGTYTLTKL
ncbi:MAG: SusE domain-containing protein [Ferruginibacter sp.]|nr:SusE domain-containing protein [Bacteroidota bacterium]MBX2918885.1 SusE domain-containing protein [Ferruginibacter sp.]MCB0709052.1 SusE domain-containing protein [Chitinophagaceae bacterium]